MMSEALEEIGDTYGIYGFSGHGRHEVEFYLVKHFHEPLTGAAKGRVGAIEPKRSTRMGAALRHAVAKMRGVAARSKHIILLSDGFPQDLDYGEDRRSNAYGIQDTMMAFQEASRAGVTPFCITVDKAGHDYLKEMCEASRYLVIDDITARCRASCRRSINASFAREVHDATQPSRHPEQETVRHATRDLQSVRTWRRSSSLAGCGRRRCTSDRSDTIGCRSTSRRASPPGEPAPPGTAARDHARRHHAITSCRGTGWRPNDFFLWGPTSVRGQQRQPPARHPPGGARDRAGDEGPPHQDVERPLRPAISSRPTTLFRNDDFRLWLPTAESRYRERRALAPRLRRRARPELRHLEAAQHAPHGAAAALPSVERHARRRARQSLPREIDGRPIRPWESDDLFYHAQGYTHVMARVHARASSASTRVSIGDRAILAQLFEEVAQLARPRRPR